MGLTLVLGGARSGKSRFAQKLAEEGEKPVLFVATAAPGDEEMRRRIELHRRGRPTHWRTLEAFTGVGAAVMRDIGDAHAVIVDCVTVLLSNLWGGEEAPGEEVEEQAKAEIEGIVRAANSLSARFIVVSNEVGFGLVPPYPAGRAYRDLLGLANQWLAREADEVYLLVAGLPLRLKPRPWL
ncbi:MAG: bifunctional adenosylcobinamide kinase/adenosylcobinamide-phosphate guanylyltransferase [Dehalococcoidia bacterium]|jgi:adenosylcobinamide kinase/adenosylcobinamide-phosphate guanylyltransferase|nr:bifunctional adenosylcobinamide kinase/adenosylcobinamide-phosphate guanylyltransferase [Dehalococcoidia bacterium]MDP6510955.1 bifunctional adenosylcobinamide kinase/adenosylcobinamide-phosphate guanylyltransferase [Dehalococcoidia bacterium]